MKNTITIQRKVQQKSGQIGGIINVLIHVGKIKQSELERRSDNMELKYNKQ